MGLGSRSPSMGPADRYPPPRPAWVWGILVASIVLVAVGVGLFLWQLGLASGSRVAPHPFWGFFGGFLLLLLILWLAFFVLRVAFWSQRHRYRRYGGGPGGGYGPHRDPARMIARERYARGEITREQLDQILTDLDRRRNPP